MCCVWTASPRASTGTTGTGCPPARAGDTVTAGTSRLSNSSQDARNTNQKEVQKTVQQRSWRGSLKVTFFISMWVKYVRKSIVDLRDRARDVLYSICKYCLDVVSDWKVQTDLVSGNKEKVRNHPEDHHLTHH